LLLLTGAMVEARDLPTECCTEKRVGSVSYTLLSDTFDGELPRQCLNSCVYTVSGTSSKKFCFAKGDLPTECLNDDQGQCLVQANTDYYGKDIVNTTLAGPYDCAVYCANNHAAVGCLFWTFDSQTGVCFAKSSRTGQAVDRNTVSGNRACGVSGDLPTVALSVGSAAAAAGATGQCLVQANTDYYGKDIVNTTLAGPYDCAVYCANNHAAVGCLFWTFDSQTGVCFAKSSRTGQAVDRNTVSGNRACGVSALMATSTSQPMSKRH